MTSDLETYLATDIFLQSAKILGAAACTLSRIEPTEPLDVLVLRDFVHRHGAERFFRVILPRLVLRLPPRVLVVEPEEFDGIMVYPRFLTEAGLRLHRGKLFTLDDGKQWFVLELHRKEPDNAPAP